MRYVALRVNYCRCTDSPCEVMNFYPKSLSFYRELLKMGIKIPGKRMCGRRNIVIYFFWGE